jgi:hypothetical protein
MCDCHYYLETCFGLLIWQTLLVCLVVTRQYLKFLAVFASTLAGEPASIFYEPTVTKQST